jgi:cell division protein ZapA
MENMERNSTDVIIEDRVYTISTDQDAAYVRRLAEYINEKMELLHRQPEYSKQPNGIRQMLVLMNMADDYCRMKQQAEEAKKRYEQQETEFYNMKREMVNMQLTMANMKKKLEEKKQSSQAVCPYLQSLQEKAEAAEACEAHKENIEQQVKAESQVKVEKQTEPVQEAAAAVQSNKPHPPYGTFTHNAATHKKK